MARPLQSDKADVRPTYERSTVRVDVGFVYPSARLMLSTSDYLYRRACVFCLGFVQRQSERMMAAICRTVWSETWNVIRFFGHVYVRVLCPRIRLSPWRPLLLLLLPLVSWTPWLLPPRRQVEV